MLCEHCHENQANVHITQVVNGKRIDLNLCESCYQKEAGKFSVLVQQDFNFHNLLAGLLLPGAGEAQEPAAPGAQCRECGQTYADFGKLGQLGCAKCYEYLTGQLEHVLRRIHGNTAHVGKVPRRTGGLVRVRKEVVLLRNRLQDAIAREAYEEAASLRDEIHLREQELG
jgi:protein arginine kinase activator